MWYYNEYQLFGGYTIPCNKTTSNKMAVENTLIFVKKLAERNLVLMSDFFDFKKLINAPLLRRRPILNSTENKSQKPRIN